MVEPFAAEEMRSRPAIHQVDLPPAFIERMGAMLGSDLPEFLEALSEPPVGLRVNTLRCPVTRFESIAPFALERLGYPEEGFAVPSGERPGSDPYHAAGLYYLQDPGAMAVAALIDPQPGERVIDLAAAPGGKTTHLAARMVNEGLLVANDVHRGRAAELVGNLERCGVQNTIVVSEPLERLASHFGAYFDRVLLDAPCSGEAMFHKSVAAREDWSPEVVLGCARRQGELIRSAADLVRPGGLLVYSTCTFSVEENEHVVDSFLSGAPDFEPLRLQVPPGAEEVELGGGRSAAAAGAALRLWPHRVRGAGHFVAGLRRIDGPSVQASSAALLSPGREHVQSCLGFLHEIFPAARVDRDRLVARGSNLYHVPEGAPDLRGLNVVRPGLGLGEALPKRFEPAHALAMAFGSGATRRVDLSRDDPRVGDYLRGHPILAQGVPGWLPVTVDGFPLGWGKRVGGTVKNHYPKGLRRRA